MSCTLIINPASRNGRSRKHIDGIIAKCSEKLDQVDIRYASGFYELRELSRKANLGDAGQVVAVGGDGTINAVLNGFYDGNDYNAYMNALQNADNNLLLQIESSLREYLPRKKLPVREHGPPTIFRMNSPFYRYMPG